MNPTRQTRKPDPKIRPTLWLMPKHSPAMTPPSKAMRQSWKSAFERVLAARRAA
jgi:hypothetical protein